MGAFQTFAVLFAFTLLCLTQVKSYEDYNDEEYDEEEMRDAIQFQHALRQEQLHSDIQIVDDRSKAKTQPTTIRRKMDDTSKAKPQPSLHHKTIGNKPKTKPKPSLRHKTSGSKKKLKTKPSTHHKPKGDKKKLKPQPPKHHKITGGKIKTKLQPLKIHKTTKTIRKLTPTPSMLHNKTEDNSKAKPKPSTHRKMTGSRKKLKLKPVTHRKPSTKKKLKSKPSTHHKTTGDTSHRRSLPGTDKAKPLQPTPLNFITAHAKKAISDLMKQIGRTHICNLMKDKLNITHGILTEKGGIIELKPKEGQTIYLKEIIPLTGLDITIQHVKIDCSKTIITISTVPAGTTTIIPHFMSIDNLNVQITAASEKTEYSLVMKMNGKCIIGDLSMEVELSYTSSKGLTVVKITPNEHTSVKSFVKSVTGLSLPISPSVKLGFSFEGSIAENGFTTLTLSSDNGANKYYAVYQKKNHAADPAKCIALELKDFQLSEILKKLVNLDISSVPFFGNLKAKNLGIIFADGDIELPQNMFSKSNLLKMAGKTIEDGFTAYITVPFHNEPLIAKYNKKELVLTTPKKNLQLDSIIRDLVKDKNSVLMSIPSQLKNVLKTIVQTVKITSHEVSVSVAYPNSITFFNGTIGLSQIQMTMTLSTKSPKVTAVSSGVINLAGSELNTQLFQDKHGKYVVTASGDNLDINQLFASLNAQVLPTSANKFLQKIPFVNFSVRKPKLQYTLGAVPKRIDLGGSPVIQGFKVITMEAIVVELNGVTNTILGFELGEYNFASLLGTITGRKIKEQFPFLSQTVTSSVIVSPIASPTLHFNTGKLASLPIAKGVSVQSSMKFPHNCNSDNFCKYAGMLVGESAVFNLKATITSSTHFLISAALSNVILGKGMVLAKAGIEIEGGMSPKVGLVGEVTLKKPPLLFGARISAGTKGLSMALTVKNCWHKAFNADWLSICNFHGEVNFAPPTAIVGFAFAAEIHLGYESTGHQIKAKGHFGVNIINALEDYYYAEFSKITMESLFEAFKITKTIPKALAQSGLPNGFLSSFSPRGKELPHMHMSIPSGYRLQGTLNILGLEGSADITINLPKMIDIKVVLPPIKVGSLLSMYQSSRNAKDGPSLKAKVQVIPTFDVDVRANGYLKVLGISIETALTITNTHFEFSISGKVLSLFEASLEIIAGYNKDISTASFRVKGEFGLDLFKDIKEFGASLFRGIADIANKAIQEAKRIKDGVVDTLTEAKQAVQQAWEKFQNLCGIGGAQAASYSGTRCRRPMARGLHTYSARRSKTTTRIMEGGKEIYSDKLLKKAEEDLKKAEMELDSAEAKLNEAEKKLNETKEKCHTGLHVHNYITDYGTEDIFSIRRLWFDVSLGDASAGEFAGGIDIRFFGKDEISFELKFNLHKIKTIAKSIFQEVLKRIRQFGDTIGK